MSLDDMKDGQNLSNVDVWMDIWAFAMGCKTNYYFNSCLSCDIVKNNQI